jgi:uncharacterized membrane-anchored protein YhcB (DUF1043 family)
MRTSKSFQKILSRFLNETRKSVQLFQNFGAKISTIFNNYQRIYEHAFDQKKKLIAKLLPTRAMQLYVHVSTLAGIKGVEKVE